MKEMLRTPFRRIHMLMNSLSLTTLHMPILKSKNIVRILAVEQEGMIRTFAWHIDNQINIDVKRTCIDMVGPRQTRNPASSIPAGVPGRPPLLPR